MHSRRCFPQSWWPHIPLSSAALGTFFSSKPNINTKCCIEYLSVFEAWLPQDSSTTLSLIPKVKNRAKDSLFASKNCLCLVYKGYKSKECIQVVWYSVHRCLKIVFQYWTHWTLGTLEDQSNKLHYFSKRHFWTIVCSGLFRFRTLVWFGLFGTLVCPGLWTRSIGCIASCYTCSITQHPPVLHHWAPQI